MAERLKSRVLHREEKFMGTVTMARFLVCVLSTGGFYFVLRLLGFGVINIFLSLIVFVLAIFLTADKFGMMRYQWWLLEWRGRLLLDAHRHPSSFAAQVVQLLAIQSPVVLRANQLFTGNSSDDDLQGLIVLESDDLDDAGFEVLSDADIIVELQP